MRVRVRAASIGLLTGLLGAGPTSAAVTESDFMATTTANLVALCSAEPHDPLYTAAANFCHGFTVGTVRALAEIAPAMRGRKLYCPPAAPPSRSQAVAGFVAWAAARPDVLAMPPSDGLTDYLMTTYPCP